jgi:hypothetical protein
MVSPTWVEAHGGIELGQSNPYADMHTCGTGPYMVTQRLVNDHITLQRNDDYWRASSVIAENPNAGSIETFVLWSNDDDNSRKSNLLSGKTDGCFWPRADADEIWDSETGTSKDASISVGAEDLDYTLLALGFNLRNQFNQEGTPRLNPFSIKDFRIACSYAYDYETFIENALDGLATRGQGPVPIGMWGHDDSLFVYDNNLELAVEAWNNAMATGLDTILADNSYRLVLPYTSYPAWPVQPRQMCLLLKAGIEAILTHEQAIQPSQPLEIQVVEMSFQDYRMQRNNGELIVLATFWIQDFADPDNYLLPFCYSPSAWAKWIGYSNLQVDEWFETSRGEMDTEARLQLIHQIQQAVVDDVAYVWLGQTTDFHVERSHLRGYVFNPMLSITTWRGVSLPYIYNCWKDAEPPETTVTGPPNGATVSESSTYHVESSDLSGVSRTEIYLDGELVLEAESDIVDYTLDPSLVDDGEHVLTILVYDNFGQEQVTVYVVFTDTTPPEVTVDLPPATSEPVDCVVDAYDENGINRVEFWLDEVLVYTDYTIPYVYYVYTPDLVDGPHSLTIIVYDNAGNHRVEVCIFIVDQTPPQITVTGITEGQNIAGIIALGATLVDFSEIDRVDIYVDGSLYWTPLVWMTVHTV